MNIKNMLTHIDVKRFNAKSKMNLTLQETLICDEAFQTAIETLDNRLSEMYPDIQIKNKPLLTKRTISLNKIKIRLAEMFENEVESNY